MTEVIGFIGLGNMGLPMVAQLLQAGHGVRAFDLSRESVQRAEALGADSVRITARSTLQTSAAKEPQDRAQLACKEHHGLRLRARFASCTLCGRPR